LAGFATFSFCVRQKVLLQWLPDGAVSQYLITDAADVVHFTCLFRKY